MAHDSIKIVWSKPLDEEIIPFLKNLPRDVIQIVEEILEDYTDDITNWMQVNAPWEDRTESARASLRAQVQQGTKRIIRLLLFYEALEDERGHDYGKYLENMQGGRFQILRPAMDEFFPQIQASIQAALSGARLPSRRFTHNVYGDWGE